MSTSIASRGGSPPSRPECVAPGRSKLFLWVETRSITGLPVALVFTWFFFRGVTGTLAWHRLDREDSRAAAVTAAPVPAPRFRTREEYHAWKEQRELERAGTGRH